MAAPGDQSDNNQGNPQILAQLADLQTQLVDVQTQLNTRINGVEDLLAAQAAVLRSQLSTLVTDLKDQLTAHDTDRASQISSHDSDLKGDVDTHNSTIQTELVDLSLQGSNETEALSTQLGTHGTNLNDRTNEIDNALVIIEGKLDVRLDATISSRASQVSVNDLDGDVGTLSIKVTDETNDVDDAMSTIEGKLDANLDAQVSSLATQASVDDLDADVVALSALVTGETGEIYTTLAADGREAGRESGCEGFLSRHPGQR